MHQRLLITALLVACWLVAGWGESARAAYTVERVVGGLNQPVGMVQAPGDNNSLYIVERSDTGNQLGRIRKFDMQTQTFSTFLDVAGSINSDGGLLGLTFNPDYQTNGLFYTTSNNNGTNALDEYKVVSGAPVLQRRLLQYQNLNNVFHTINQVHFRPNGNNNELFVTMGDGGTQADEAGFNPALIESPSSVYGKMLRFDLTASFPTPATDATHAGVSVALTGLRNPFRSGFDRQTGDFYIGDVGFNTAEEVNYVPSSFFANPANPPLNFGWTSREGTIATTQPGVGGPGSPGDLNPIFDYAHYSNPLPHPTQLIGSSITGGYVYRGPVAELQGRYFFSDFSNGNVYSGNFDTSTPTANYNGTNLTGLTNHTTAFETAIGGGANIQFVTSFGEDNAGNLYIVKFGNAFFPALGQGEIFRIVPAAAINVTVNRDTGAITLTNNTTAAVNLTSLTINSPFGAINPTALTPITGHYDSTGNGSVDGNNPWQITSAAGNNLTFTEVTTGDAGTLGVGQQIVLSAGGGWLKSPMQDLAISLVVNGSPLATTVAYAGNGGHAFNRSDLNFNGTLTAADWAVFLTGAYTNLSGLSKAESYAFGDLDGDGDSDFVDFRLFKQDYDAVNGVGAFVVMSGIVPEPSATVLICVACMAATLFVRSSHTSATQRWVTVAATRQLC
ncbi:PQQ-dependent sugar dehydrogenase [Lacipirellula sp.]|uniref:PQQ-dependent sugar dehydrogenase n=1 Tax=Lacipirellula sp. TaxID=2691419 RepID=UPI003D0D096C